VHSTSGDVAEFHAMGFFSGLMSNDKRTYVVLT